jgi:hypothetical protein
VRCLCPAHVDCDSVADALSHMNAGAPMRDVTSQQIVSLEDLEGVWCVDIRPRKGFKPAYTRCSRGVEGTWTVKGTVLWR